MTASDKPMTGQGGITVSASCSEQVPFIYFDGVTCFGQRGGAIQVELAANVLIPGGTGVKIDVVQVAHLRCNLLAAIALRDALDKAVAMIQQGSDQPQSIPALKN